MTIEEAYADCPSFESFAYVCCVYCKSDRYCTACCDMLEKAKRMPFEKIIKSYAHNEGDIAKVARYIKRYKEN